MGDQPDMHPTQAEPRWVTITEAADQSEIPHRTLRRWADLGFLPSKREGRRVMVDLDAVELLRRSLPPPRHAPLRRGLAGRQVISAGLAVSWPEVDLLIEALHDGAELRAALHAAHDHDPARDDLGDQLDQAARYALMAARLGLARDMSGDPR